MPKKFTQQSGAIYTLPMCLGFFIGSTLQYSITPGGGNFNLNILLYSGIAGIFWAAGSVLLMNSIDLIGLSRSNQWKNLQGPIGVILSLIILSEFTQTNASYTIIAGILICASAFTFWVIGKDDKTILNKGIFLAIASASMFGVVTVINKYVTNLGGIQPQMMIWSFSTFVSIFIYILCSKKQRTLLRLITKRTVGCGIIGGVFFSIAGFLMLGSYTVIPASIAFTIIQLNTIWIVTIGIFFFREIPLRKNLFRIFSGYVLAIFGIVILYFAKR